MSKNIGLCGEVQLYKGPRFPQHNGDYLNLYAVFLEDDKPGECHFVLATSKKDCIEKVAWKQGIHPKNARAWENDSFRCKKVPDSLITKLVEDVT